MRIANKMKIYLQIPPNVVWKIHRCHPERKILFINPHIYFNLNCCLLSVTSVEAGHEVTFPDTVFTITE